MLESRFPKCDKAINTSLAELPPELQFLTFDHLTDDYIALSALVLVSRSIAECTLKVLQNCALDFFDGNTDEIESALDALLHRAKTSARAPQVLFTSTGNNFGESVIRNASRFTIFRLRFATRHGHVAQGTQPILPSTVNFFRSAMQALTGKPPKHTISWGQNFGLRKADASVHLILHAPAPHRYARIGRCDKLFAVGHDRLEFSNMGITLGFLEFFPRTPGTISATTLCFANCWVPHRSVERIVGAFSGLVTFEYSLNRVLAKTQTYWNHTANSMIVLYRLPQSLTKLEPSGCARIVIGTLLSRIERGTGVGSLRELTITYSERLPSGITTRAFTRQELELIAAFRQQGVTLKLLHTTA
ncbi:uncharacterized protein M421DRAFT_93745 [Didymella exigua CBS 183.55]|uniref:Uncharacterized protein n=1 Tax=Didymella exigua CBS 183.55 TaxID=1150837 RepID=A0A6A5RHY2_9PLEO|nr:uncharacterized protein M421DRAFT_93745 [Didymella exigua CBS 183.55]KAF1926850.1 hypothetical protein M421DRAFT_93745 [Didymella exigua CBS 183.55]